jgi:hypothetical protein
MNYPLLVVMILSAVLILGVTSVVMQVIGYADIPSEEYCQRIIGYGSYQQGVAAKHWCEYNESGWHFNKTAFKESFDSGGALT